MQTAPAITINVIVADDHPMFLKGVISALRTTSHQQIQVIGEATNGKELCELTNQLQPNVVITDISMPDMSGIEALRYIKQHYPNTGFVTLSMHEEVAVIKEALQAGAHAYLPKTAPANEIVEGVRSAYRKKPYFAPSLLPLLTNLVQYLCEDQPLNDREQQILRLLFEEFTSKEISQQLFLSERTVEDHRKNLLKKTGAKTTIGLIKYALRHLLVKLNKT